MIYFGISYWKVCFFGPVRSYKSLINSEYYVLVFFLTVFTISEVNGNSSLFVGDALFYYFFAFSLSFKFWFSNGYGVTINFWTGWACGNCPCYYPNSSSSSLFNILKVSFLLYSSLMICLSWDLRCLEFIRVRLNGFLKRALFWGLNTPGESASAYSFRESLFAFYMADLCSIMGSRYSVYCPILILNPACYGKLLCSKGSSKLSFNDENWLINPWLPRITAGLQQSLELLLFFVLFY